MGAKDYTIQEERELNCGKKQIESGSLLSVLLQYSYSKCGKCSLGAKDYTIQEERELELIEPNLTFNSEDNTWTVEYPWIKDPNNLPDNRKVAMAKLAATERRLRKNADHAKVYDEQIKDMVARNVARKLSKEELTNYTGPTHYIAHHEVLKSESKSTPVRIVFNSSANYMGHVLNRVNLNQTKYTCDLFCAS